jgi:hypothetical protein
LNKNKLYHICISILFVLSIYSCSDKNDSPASKEELKFNIDRNLIADKIDLDEYNISFSPPVNWGAISGSLFDSLSYLMKDQPISEEIKIIPLKVFSDSSSRSILNVTAIKVNADSQNNIINNLEKELLKKYGKTGLKRADYLKDDIPVTQFLITDNEVITFKILIINDVNQIIEFDYSTLKNSYPNEVKSIESSIGSIKLTNHKL